MALFAEMNARAGECIPERLLFHKIQLTLNPKEQDEFVPAVNELIGEGLVELKDAHGNALFLTETGFGTLY